MTYRCFAVITKEVARCPELNVTSQRKRCRERPRQPGRSDRAVSGNLGSKRSPLDSALTCTSSAHAVILGTCSDSFPGDVAPLIASLANSTAHPRRFLA